MVEVGSGQEIDRGKGRTMAKRDPERDEITVIMPDEPPHLNPEAASVLLRILLKAYEKEFGHEYLPAREQ